MKKTQDTSEPTPEWSGFCAHPGCKYLADHNIHHTKSFTFDHDFVPPATSLLDEDTQLLENLHQAVEDVRPLLDEPILLEIAMADLSVEKRARLRALLERMLELPR